MPRYKLRTLLIVLALGPVVIAAGWWWFKAASVCDFRGAGQTLRIRRYPQTPP